MLLGSILLVGLAGCFLIGVLGLLRPELFMGGMNPAGVGREPVTLTSEERLLLFVLYGCAFASLFGAILLFILGVRGMCRLLFAESS
jgi:hypothetical protein